MAIPREFIDLLLSKIDIVDVVTRAQVALPKKTGSNYFGRCPFHQEKSASFSVSQPKQFYYCFGCGAHGNAIDFLMNYDHLSFKEAIHQLASNASLSVPDQLVEFKKHKNIDQLEELMNQTASFYYENMRKSERAITYLKSRHLSGKIVQQFQLGYAASHWQQLIDTFGKSEQEKQLLLDLGLIIKKSDHYYDRFRDRIMFPIHNPRGQIIGFGGRILDTGEPKYLNSPETIFFQKGQELYGLYQALKENRELKRLLIVEGYMDVIALFQHGITFAVATLGTATTPLHIKRLLRHTAEIIFCFDGDKAGKMAAWRAVQVVLPLLVDGIDVRFLFLPDGEDPDSLVQKIGADQFLQELAKAASLSDFLLQTLIQQCDLTHLEGRAKLVSLALPLIKQLPPGVLSAMLLEELSKRSRIALNDIKKQFATPERSTVLLNKPVTQTKISTPLKTALRLLIQTPNLAELVTDPLPPQEEPFYRFFLNVLETIKSRPNITTGALKEHWRGQPEEEWLEKFAKWQHLVPEAGIEKEFLGALRQLHLSHIENEINQLLAKAADASLNVEEKTLLAAFIAKKKALAFNELN